MAEQPGGLYVAIQPVGDAAFTELLVGDYGSLPSPSPTALIVGSAVITGEFKVK
jgi:hypothetical protein